MITAEVVNNRPELKVLLKRSGKNAFIEKDTKVVIIYSSIAALADIIKCSSRVVYPYSDMGYAEYQEVDNLLFRPEGSEVAFHVNSVFTNFKNIFTVPKAKYHVIWYRTESPFFHEINRMCTSRNIEESNEKETTI